MRWCWLIWLLAGCGTTQAPVPQAKTPVASHEPTELPEVAPAVLDTKQRFGPAVVDLAPFLPGTEAVLASIDGQPYYAFRRGADLFPLIAQSQLAPEGSCLPLRVARALWLFDDGVAYSPAEGVLLVPGTDPGARCWKRMGLAALSAYAATTSVPQASAVDKPSVAATSKRDAETYVARLQLGNTAVLTLGKSQLAIVEDPFKRLFLQTPSLWLNLSIGGYPNDADSIIAIDSAGDGAFTSLDIDWQGTPNGLRLVQWHLDIAGEDGDTVVDFAKASRLPLKSGAVLDTTASSLDRSESQPIGAYIDIVRTVRASLTFAGQTLQLWPPVGPVAATVAAAALPPLEVISGDCHVALTDDVIVGLVVTCGATTHRVLLRSLDGASPMKLAAEDFGDVIRVHVQYEADSGGELDRKWLFPKVGGRPLVVFADDLDNE